MLRELVNAMMHRIHLLNRFNRGLMDMRGVWWLNQVRVDPNNILNYLYIHTEYKERIFHRTGLTNGFDASLR